MSALYALEKVWLRDGGVMPIVRGLVLTLLGAFFYLLLLGVYFTILEKVTLGGDGITTTYFGKMPALYLVLSPSKGY